MSQSAKTAIGSMVTALSVVIMMPTAMDIFCYALPAIAGMLILISVIELGKKWAFGIFAATALISLLFVPNKEAAVMYVCFFGYYPIFKALIEDKFPIVIEWIIKIVSFLATMAGSYFLMIKFMGVTIDETEEWGVIAYPILLGMGTFAFVLYDIALTKTISLYIMKWQKQKRLEDLRNELLVPERKVL